MDNRIYGCESVSIPSRFINEIDDELINFENKNEKREVKREKQVYDSDQTFNYGDKVNHDVYGDGVVIEVTKTI